MKRTFAAKPHTVSAFDDDLEAVRDIVTRMADLSSAALLEAMDAFLEADSDRIHALVVADAAIDDLNYQLEKRVIQTIALRAPMADDLRFLITAIRIGSLLERAGDHAKGVARQSGAGSDREFDVARTLLREMGTLAGSMIIQAVNSFNRMDPAAAQQVREIDREMNDLYRELTRVVTREVEEDGRLAGDGLTLMLMAKNLERTGDYAANIANSVSFVVSGHGLPGWDQGPQ